MELWATVLSSFYGETSHYLSAYNDNNSSDSGNIATAG